MATTENQALTDTDIETARRWARQLAEAADGGPLTVHIVEPADWGPVFDAYMSGDFLAGRLAEVLMEMTAGRRTAHGRESSLCR